MIETLIQEIDDLFKGKPFLTVDDITGLLNCNPKVVYNWTKRADPYRRPPRIPIGRELRFPKRAFVHWLVSEASKKAEVESKDE